MSDVPSGPVGDTQPDPAVTAKQLATLSNFITSTYRPGMDPELVMRRRVGKVSNEVGEVWEAIEAWTGENFRKGVYGTKDDVIKELLDVACAALCATEHLTGDSAEALPRFLAHVAAMCTRAGVGVDANHVLADSISGGIRAHIADEIADQIKLDAQYARDGQHFGYAMGLERAEEIARIIARGGSVAKPTT